VNLDGILNLLGQIVTLALVATILLRGTAFAQIVASLGSAFSGAIRAAKG
jgi:hypothetical protein